MERTLSHDIAHPAAKVWGLLSDFGNISWLGRGIQRVESQGSGPGMSRTLYWQYATEPSIQQLEAIDNKRMTMRYSVRASASLPVTALHVSHRVAATSSGQCRLHTHFELHAEAAEYEADLLQVLESWVNLLAENLATQLRQSPPD